MYPVLVKVTTTSSEVISDSSSITSSLSEISVLLGDCIFSLISVSSFINSLFNLFFDERISK